MKNMIFIALVAFGMSSPAFAENEHSDNGAYSYIHQLETFRGQKHADANTKIPTSAKKAKYALVGTSNSSVYNLVTNAAIRHGIAPAVLHAVIQVESRYSCSAHNGSGASGIGQVLPSTARGVGVYGNLHDCSVGIEASARVLKQGIALYGNTCGGYSSYNTGTYKTGYCTSYGRKIMSLAHRFSGSQVAAM